MYVCVLYIQTVIIFIRECDPFREKYICMYIYRESYVFIVHQDFYLRDCFV